MLLEKFLFTLKKKVLLGIFEGVHRPWCHLQATKLWERPGLAWHQRWRDGEKLDPQYPEPWAPLLKYQFPCLNQYKLGFTCSSKHPNWYTKLNNKPLKDFEIKANSVLERFIWHLCKSVQNGLEERRGSKNISSGQSTIIHR